MLSNQSVKNEKPQDKVAAKSRGNEGIKIDSINSTTDLTESKARWERGQELFKAGAVSIGKDSYFRVNGFKVDTDPVRCECPDFKNRKQACKHCFAALAFLKAKQNGNGSTHKGVESSKEASNKPKEGHSKSLDRQATITKLAVLNTATEILKTHRKQIELAEVLSLAGELEAWALGN